MLLSRIDTGYLANDPANMMVKDRSSSDPQAVQGSELNLQSTSSEC